MRRLENRFGRPKELVSHHMAWSLFHSWIVGGQDCEVGFLIMVALEDEQVSVFGRSIPDSVAPASFSCVPGVHRCQQAYSILLPAAVLIFQLVMA